VFAKKKKKKPSAEKVKTVKKRGTTDGPDPKQLRF